MLVFLWRDGIENGCESRLTNRPIATQAFRYFLISVIQESCWSRLYDACIKASLVQPQDRFNTPVAVVSYYAFSSLSRKDQYGTPYMSSEMIKSPVVVGLNNTIQPRRWVTNSIDSYNHWITSLRSAVFPASGLCKNARAMAYALDVVLGGIPGKGTCGVKPSDIRPNEFRKFLRSCLVVPFQSCGKQRTHIVVPQISPSIHNIYHDVCSSGFVVYEIFVIAEFFFIW